MLVAFKLILVIFVIGHVTLVILSYQQHKSHGNVTEEEDKIVFLILFFYFGIVAI